MIQHRLLRAVLALALVTTFLGQPVLASTISLTWDPVSHPDLSGYRLYVDDGSGGFSQSVDVGLVTSATLSGLADCTAYTVGVKAHDAEGEESPSMSNLISGWARPELISVSPTQVEQNEATELVLSGKNFQAGATVAFSDPAITVQSVSWSDCHQLVVSVSVNATASQGPVALEVVNPDQVFGSASGLLSVTADGTAPTIDEVAASAIAATSAHIVWTTDEPASGTVFFRRQGETTYQQEVVASLASDHDILLQGLAPETTYEFYVASADAAGNPASSPVETFTTLISSDTYLRFEAEAGSLGSPVHGLIEGGTFRGGSIELPAGSPPGTAANPKGGAAFGFQVPSAGTWRVWVRVHTSDSQGRSWFESVDGAALLPLAPATVGQWSWVGGRSYQLAQGLHAFALGGYHAAARADRVLITDDPDFVPTEEPGDDTAAPPAVTGASVEAGESAAELSWTAPQSADAVTLVIRYRTDAYFPTSPVDGLPLAEETLTPGVGGSHQHTGLNNGTTYRYALFTVDASGNASDPVQLTSTPQASVPAPVTNLERTDRK